MATDLNDIYDPHGVDQEAPKPKPAPARGLTPDSYLALRGSTPDAMPRAGASFSFNADQGDIQKYFGESGVGDPGITGQNLLLEMGARQSVGNKVARRIGNLVPNIVSNLIDIAGRTGALLTEFGDNRDYENALTEVAKDMRDPFGANYARTDQSTIASSLSDPTWWIDNTAMLIEYAAPYALAGAGAGSFMSSLTRGAAGVLQTGATGARVLNALGKGLTAGWMAYSESAQAGEQVFKDVYDNQLRKGLAEGMTLDEARTNAQHVASQSAASTVQLGTALTTALNLHAISPYFKSADDAAASALRSQAQRLAGETPAQWASRIKGLQADELVKGRGAFYHKLLEAGMEGTEEVVQQFAQQSGSDLGKDGQVLGFLEQFGQLENFYNRIANKDGVLSFALGAVGGGLMEFVQTNVIPSRRVQAVDAAGVPIQNVNEDGELEFTETGVPIYRTKLVTPRSFDEWQTKRAFNSLRDSFAFDIENYSKAQGKLSAAVKAGDLTAADLAREQLLSPTQINAVINGMVEPWIATFQGIADTDNEASLAEGMIPALEEARALIQSATTPEEVTAAEDNYNALMAEYQRLDTTDAVRQGFAKDRNDNTYKDKAQEAISSLKEYEKEYDALRTKFGTQYESNIGMKQYVDMLFARKVDLMSMDRVLRKHEQILQERENEEMAGIRTTNKAVFSDLLTELNKQYKSLREVQGRMQADLDMLRKAGETNDMAVIRRLIGKYRAVGINETDVPSAVKDLVRKINQHNERLIQRTQQAEENIYNSPAYMIWREKNPDGTFTEFMQELNKSYSLSEENQAYRASIEDARQQYDIINQNYLDIANEKSINKFTKKSNDWISQMQQERQRVQEAETAELARRAKDKAGLNKLQRAALNKSADRYRQLRDLEAQKAVDYDAKLKALIAEADAVSLIKDPLKKMGLQKQIKELRALLAQANAQMRKYGELADFYAIDMATPDIEYPVESLTAENNDVEEFPNPVAEPVEAAEMVAEATAPATEGAWWADQDITAMDDTEFDEFLSNIDNITSAGAPAIEVENDSASYEITKDFARKLYPLSDELKERMLDIEEDLRKGKTGFSYDMLKPQVAAGLISQADAVNLLEMLREYLIAEQVLQRSPEELSYLAVQETKDPAQYVDSSGIGIADTPVIQNTEENTVTNVSSSADGNGLNTHEGFKNVNVVTAANATTKYMEVYDEKDKAYYKIDTNNELNDNLNPDILIPGKLEASTRVRLEVDTEYDGDANINDNLVLDDKGERVMAHESFGDYLDDNGQIKTGNSSIGNVPIKIVDIASGNTVGYVRKLDWIVAKFPRTSDYRNVVSTKTDSDGKIIDLMPDHIRSIMDVREMVVAQFNRSKSPVDAKVTNKGTGIVMTNHEINNAGKRKLKAGFARSKNPENSLLPDESLKLAIIGTEGQVFTSDGTLFDGKVVGTNELRRGNVIAILPTATKNLFAFGALIGQPLVDDKRKSALNTMARAIELYLLNDGTNPEILDEVKKLEANTAFENFGGFNVGTAKGLKSFLNQYITYSQPFNDLDTSPNAPTKGPKVEQFLFNVWEPIGNQTKGSIKLGWSYSGRPVLQATLINGRLDPRFTEALMEGLSTRAHAVVYTKPDLNIRGINSRGAFKDAIYTEAGKWMHPEYPSYNEYVKSFSKTFAYGRNKIGGRYVYTANPQIAYKVENSTKNLSKENKSPKKVNVKKDITAFDAGAADLFDNLNSFSIRPTSQLATGNQIGSAPENSRPLSMDTLREMYNFTPDVQRNGKTPQEVYDTLTKNGHSFLAQGYNPFSRCL